MENVITEVSKYLIILLMMIYTFSCFTVFRKRDIEDQKNVLRRQIVLMLFVNLVAYTVLFLQDNDMKMLMMYGAVFLFIVVVQILYRVIYRKGNMLIVNNMCMLLSIGFLILSRLSFGKAVKQFEIVVIGMVLSFIVPVIVRKVKILKDLTWLYGIVGLALLMVVLAMAAISGEQSGSTDMTVHTTDTSFLISLGNRGRIGRSMTREVRMALSLGRPSLFRKEPGILPTAYSFSSKSTDSGKKSMPSLGLAEAVTATFTTVSP